MDPGRNLLCNLISQRNPGSEKSGVLPEVIAVDGGRPGGAQGPRPVSWGYGAWVGLKKTILGYNQNAREESLLSP